MPDLMDRVIRAQSAEGFRLVGMGVAANLAGVTKATIAAAVKDGRLRAIRTQGGAGGRDGYSILASDAESFRPNPIGRPRGLRS